MLNKPCRLGGLLMIIAFALSAFSACKSIDNSDSNHTGVNLEQSGPKILFLTYAIKRDDTRRITLDLVNMVVSDGLLKTALSDKNHGNPGDLLCVQLDGQKSKIEQLSINNPLDKHVEYANQQGKLERKFIELNQTDFNVRLQLLPTTKFIRIEQIQKNNENVKLLTTKL